MRATTDAVEAITGASYAVHAVPVQHSRAFLSSIRDILDNHVPIVCVSKGLEVGTGAMMSEVIPQALHRRQPAVFVSGPSFAKEVMQGRPTGVVAASKDAKLARVVQELFASPCMRVNTTTDVTGAAHCDDADNDGVWDVLGVRALAVHCCIWVMLSIFTSQNVFMTFLVKGVIAASQ